MNRTLGCHRRTDVVTVHGFRSMRSSRQCREQKNDPNTEPWGTPHTKWMMKDLLDPRHMYCLRSDRYDWNHRCATSGGASPYRQRLNDVQFCAQLVLEALLNSKPMAISQQGGHVITSRWAGDQTYGCVEDGLQTLNVTSWFSPSKSNITVVQSVVQSAVYETGNERVQCMWKQRLLNRPELSQCTVPRRRHVVDAGMWLRRAGAHQINSVFSAFSCSRLFTSTATRCRSTLTCWLGAGWHQSVDTGLLCLHCYRATLCVSAAFAVTRFLSFCHVGRLYPDGWSYHQTFVRPDSPII